LVVANAIRSTSLKVRITAVEEFNRYFIPGGCSGGGSSEDEFRMAFDWLEANSARLQRESRDLPVD
jgi:hypothetical protein